MFERCCNSHANINYEIRHKPQPIVFSDTMGRIIKDLLWYVPNIDSVQATKNALVSDKVYDDFSFTYIMNMMNMVEERDVKWIEPNDPFDDDDWNYYENSICDKCQKIIITRQKNLSKTNDLLRCLRNCVAHGHFAIVDDFIIGFNMHTTKNNPIGVKRAVVKLKPQLLLNALKTLTSDMGKVSLLTYAFEKAGYTTMREVALGGFRIDLLIEKKHKRYAIEIKGYKGQAYIYPEDIKPILYALDKLSPDVERVLFIDTSRVTKSVRELEKGIDNFRIIDLSEVKLLLQDNPVDILA